MAPDKGVGHDEMPRDALDRWMRRNGQKEGERKDDGDGADDSEAGKKKSKSPFANPWIKYGGIALIAAVAIAGLLWWLNARQYENTDDAFIDTHIVHLSPQIAGQVTRVLVGDNQAVRKGQLLVVIDSADATTRLSQAEAQEAQARTQRAQAKAGERGAAAQATSAEADLARYRLLQRTDPAAVAQQQVDQAVAAARNARAQRDAARAQIAGADAQIKVDEAQIAAARLNLGYTAIAAPVDGHVAQRSVASGNYVAPGQELMAIVPNELWVTANFKETQLAHMRVGQNVSLSVDACSGGDVAGHVQSIQHGAGQAFGILPPENATGNYVKVVQRVPVKIVLDRVPKDCVLGPGMSVTPSVKVR
ncbi:MAG: HlyD family secretion protein [Alphaproteobacteria bacterium]|nr:HlyD family secretion protein [Alphaproteobacteria bacterium]